MVCGDLLLKSGVRIGAAETALLLKREWMW